ncbi:MAG: AAA family ATPase [Prosthecobacter sp.]|jgi:energy-coupling factor transporter ATP-binding protein EcfA2|uniref:ATP-binding protein n=1 Tax=Prosthecobacter sp. TaxID=1965333 RepID=UPI0019F49D96|nr:ATP-binding protein [Prosthecobacter sp.]MBE2283121.1 AAA family ATPase [Prosthecobacter sp.]
MHLHSFKISNIRTISRLEWSVSDDSSGPGWHVIIGDNGSGKSTVLRSIALALIGAQNAEALRQDWSQWLAGGKSKGVVTVYLEDQADDSWAGKGRKLEDFHPEVGVQLQRVNGKVEIKPEAGNETLPERHAWSEKPGWFGAAFGPFRRFTGGDKDSERLFFSHPRLARHLSVFGEEVALTEGLAWLAQLRFEQLDAKARSGKLLALIKNFINQDGFLPNGVRFQEVDSKGVRFVDGNGTPVSVNVLGDGFRSVLSFTFELLRQMSVAWPGSTLFSETKKGLITVKHSGVVMIDEIDAHLHPTWQRRIGFWLTKHFPKVQFIVTTHSPLVCHAAETGSIFRLPTPGSRETARMLKGIEKDRLIFGSVLDAYGTELFGCDVSRSDSAKEKQQRLAMLNQKALLSKLSTKESQERLSLQTLFPASM